MRNLPLTLILALWADDRISVRNTHNKKNLKEKLTRVSHAVYLLLRIIFIITLSEAKGTKELVLLFRGDESLSLWRLISHSLTLC